MTTHKKDDGGPALKITPARFRELDKICRTNGGGVFAGFSWPLSKPQMYLYENGLIQGKAGRQSYIVHTRDGWDLWKAMLAERNKP